MNRRMGQLGAWGVHLYTASSALIGVWAIFASFAHDFPSAMFLMLVTLAIDSTDGVLARAMDVRGRIPWFDGRRLDDICDYFTYVIVPSCFMVEAGLLPHGAWAALPVIASCYGFSRDDAKTDDHFFTGWPSYWNVLAIYLFLYQVPAWLGAALVAIFAAAVFVPLRYVYPSRTRTLRPVTWILLGVWTIWLAILVQTPSPGRAALTSSLFGPAWYLGLSLVLHFARKRRAPAVP